MNQAKHSTKARRPRRGATRRSNGAGADNARELFKQFHGAESDSFTDYKIPCKMPANVTDLGRLIELQVYADEDDIRDLSPRRDVRVTCVPRKVRGQVIGTQIYFIGGDQALDLAALGIEEEAPKDHVMIGPCQAIAYHTSKDFHDFEPSDYEHQFGEESGELPFLGYDTRNQLIYLIGGAYRVERPGIID